MMVTAPDPDCWLCGGTGQMQSESYDGRPAIPCVCTQSCSGNRRSALRLATRVHDLEEENRELRRRLDTPGER